MPLEVTDESVSIDAFEIKLATFRPYLFKAEIKSVIRAPSDPTFESIISLFRSYSIPAVSNTIAHELAPQVGKLP